MNRRHFLRTVAAGSFALAARQYFTNVSSAQAEEQVQYPPPPQNVTHLKVVRHMPDDSWIVILETDVVPCQNSNTPEDKVGWWNDQTFPVDQPGLPAWERWNAFSGHRSVHGAPFSLLPNVQVGDNISLNFSDGWTASYTVFEKTVKENKDDLGYIYSKITPRTITLRTCDGAKIYTKNGVPVPKGTRGARLTNRTEKMLVFASLDWAAPPAL
jgi:hypothetical protein